MRTDRNSERQSRITASKLERIARVHEEHIATPMHERSPHDALARIGNILEEDGGVALLRARGASESERLRSHIQAIRLARDWITMCPESEIADAYRALDRAIVEASCVSGEVEKKVRQRNE